MSTLEGRYDILFCVPSIDVGARIVRVKEAQRWASYCIPSLHSTDIVGFGVVTSFWNHITRLDDSTQIGRINCCI